MVCQQLCSFSCVQNLWNPHNLIVSLWFGEELPLACTVFPCGKSPFLIVSSCQQQVHKTTSLHVPQAEEPNLHNIHGNILPRTSNEEGLILVSELIGQCHRLEIPAKETNGHPLV